MTENEQLWEKRRYREGEKERERREREINK